MQQVLQHVREGTPLESDLVSFLGGPEELVELDRVLTVVVQGLERGALVVGDSRGNQNSRGEHTLVLRY